MSALEGRLEDDPPPADDDLPESRASRIAGLQNRLARARFCLTCQTIKSDGPSHKKRTGHPYRLLEQHEKDDEAERWRGRQKGDIASQKESISQRAADQLVNHATSSSQPAVAPTSEYRLTFGKHKRSTIREVMAADKGYLPWCIVSRVHVTQPSLQRAMEKVGVWADVLRDAEVLRERRRQKQKGQPLPLESAGWDMAEPDAPVEADVEHPEVRKLRELQAVQHAMELKTELPILSSADVGSRRKRKRQSTAMVQLKCCGQCGAADHVSTTCPRNSRAPLPPDKPPLALATQRQRKLAKVIAHLKYVSFCMYVKKLV